MYNKTMKYLIAQRILMLLVTIIKTVFLFLMHSLMSSLLSDLVIYLKFSNLLLTLDFLLLLDISLQTSMETFNLVLLNIIFIVVKLINISCIIIYIVGICMVQEVHTLI